MNSANREVTNNEDEDGEERDSDLMSDFSDEEKKHKDLKSKFKGQRQQKIPPQITQLIGDANFKYFFSNQIEEAIGIAQDIIRQYPTFTDPYELLGSIFEEQGMLKEAAEQQFLAAYQMNASAKKWEKIAHLYKDAQCYDSAGYCFGRVLKSDTLNTQLWCERAKCYEQIGELKKAIKCFERVIKMDSRHFEAIKNCAKLYLKLDKSEESVRLFKTIIQTGDQEKNFNIINMICEIHNKKNQKEELVAFLDEYCQVSSKDTQREKNLDALPLAILIFYAVTHAKLHHLDESELGFKLIMQREMEESDDYISIMKKLADTYEGIKESMKSLEIYSRLILFPSIKNAAHSQIWEKYGMLLLKLKQDEETIAKIEEIVNMFPDLIDLQTELSSIYQSLGRDQESLKILQNILKEDVGFSKQKDLFYRNQKETNSVQEESDDILSSESEVIYQEENDDNEEGDDNDGDNEEKKNEKLNKKKNNNSISFENIYLFDNNSTKKKKKNSENKNGTHSSNGKISLGDLFQVKKDYQVEQEEQDVEADVDDEDEEFQITTKKTKNKIDTFERAFKGQKNKRKKSQMDDDEDEEIFSINKYQLKDFFEQTQQKKNDLAANYSVKNLYLEYKKGQIILGDNSNVSKYKLESQFTALKNSLKLEKEFNNLKKSVMNRLLIESQKKGFQRKLTTPNNLKSFDNPNQTLLIKKKKEEEQDILLKKKFKKSEELTSQYLKNVEVLSLKIGSEEYIKYIIQILKVLLKYDCYNKISKICALAHRLYIWRDQLFSKYHETVARYGLLSALKQQVNFLKFKTENNEQLLKNFDKAFCFIKLLVNKNSDRLYLQVILCIVLRRISNVNIYKTFLSRMVKKSTVSPKFLPIIACGFLETGNFDLAIEAFLTILKNDPLNSLYNLSLGVCYAQLTTARTTFDKEQVAAKAVNYMQAYQQSRGDSKQMEVCYNLGRFFLHLSMNDKAIEQFERCISLFSTKNLKGAYNYSQTKDVDLKIHQNAVYNLILIHKTLGNASIAQSLLKSYCCLN